MTTRVRSRCRRIVAGAAAMAIAGTQVGAAAQGSAHVERLRHGDTTIVRTTGDGVWGAPKVAVVVKSIGGEDGDHSFGRLQSVAVQGDGSVVIFDPKGDAGATIDLFDKTGAFVKRIGRNGAGPGEYGDDADFGVAGNGSLLVWDPRNGRVNSYSRVGAFRHSYVFGGGLYSGDMVHGDTAGNVYVRILTGPAVGNDWPIGFLRFDAAGAMRDTIQPPVFEPPLPGAQSGRKMGEWTLMADGRILSATTDRFALLLHGPGRAVLRIERVVAPLEYQDQERAELQAESDYAIGIGAPGTYSGTRLIISRFKPTIREIDVDAERRIWVQRSAVGERIPPAPVFSGLSPNRPNANQPMPMKSFRTPTVYDVFRDDGTFLGEVRFPPKIEISGFSGDTVWGTTTDADDQPLLVQMRIPGVSTAAPPHR